MSYARWHDDLRRLAAARAWAADPVNAAWLAELDAGGDRLLAAQAALRLPQTQRGTPSVSLSHVGAARPATAEQRWAAQDEPRRTGPRPETLVAPEGTRLVGAYARRKAALDA